MQAFADIGISFCFPTFATPTMLREIRAAVPGRLMVLDLPEVEDFAEWSGLADLVLNYPFCNLAAAHGVKTALARVGVRPTSTRADDLLEDSRTFEARLGYDAYVERSKKYQAI